MDWLGLRKQARLSQTELAQLAGVSQSFIAKLERGQLDPSFSRAQKIESILQQRQLSSQDWIQSVLQPFPTILWDTQSLSSALVQLEQYAAIALPVQNERGTIVGLLHLQPLLDALYFTPNLGQSKLVRELMISPQFLPLHASTSEVRSILRSRLVVLIGSETKPLGWILPYSILKFSSLQ